MITIRKTLFGKYKEKEIYRYELKNGNDFKVNILNFGGIINFVR